MECKETQEAQKYLSKFQEILSNMAKKMLSANVVNNITIDFIECMIPHHQAAIYMCENLLQYTNYKPLEEIAEGIIKMQTRGIEQMKEIIKTTKGYCNTTEEVYRYYSRYLSITKNMIFKMKNSPRCNNINLSFINEMIPHHEGAIAMCNNLLKYRIDPRLAGVARTIIEEQSRGIKQLREIQKNLCN